MNKWYRISGRAEQAFHFRFASVVEFFDTLLVVCRLIGAAVYPSQGRHLAGETARSFVRHTTSSIPDRERKREQRQTRLALPTRPLVFPVMDRPLRMIQPTDGTNTGQFSPKDWAMVGSTALLWGSSYLWIAIGLEAFPPAMVTWLRLMFGVAILYILAGRDRTPIDRADRPAIVVVGLVGDAGPALLFAPAEQRVESAVAGMITGATPILTLVLAVAIGTKSLRRIHIVGLAIGFVGIVMMNAPNLSGEGASALGVTYVFLAVLGYSITSIVVGPLQRKYGGMAVIRTSQVVALV